MSSFRWQSGGKARTRALPRKLTGWRIDILAESKYAQIRAEEEVAERVARSLDLDENE